MEYVNDVKSFITSVPLSTYIDVSATAVLGDIVFDGHYLRKIPFVGPIVFGNPMVESMGSNVAVYLGVNYLRKKFMPTV